MVLSNEVSCEAGSFSCCLNPHRIFQSEVLRLYFPALEPCVVRSVSLPSCSSQFFHTQMWNCLLHQLPPHLVPQPLPCPPWSSSCRLARSPLCPSCLCPPLLQVRMNVSSLTSWLLDFHTVQFSGRYGYFFILNLLLSFFWLCEEAKRIYLCLHLGQKSDFLDGVL